MLKRKIYNQLIDWKNRRHKEKISKCLLVKGARQVGKTYLVKKLFSE